MNKGTLQYVIGDATQPQDPGPKLIIHICNNVGAWGAGFVMALSARWNAPEEQYRQWYDAAHTFHFVGSSLSAFRLGEIQVVEVDTDIAVVNMIAQHGVGPSFITQKPPIRYSALETCLEKVALVAKDRKATICGPRFGAGLSGGSWAKIEEIIQEKLISQGLNVTIYDLKGEQT